MAAVDKDVPPVGVAYQANVAPGGAVAVSTTLPVSHRKPSTERGGSGRALMVSTTDLRAADKQPFVKLLDATQ